MNPKYDLRWEEGMILTPQHMQTLDARSRHYIKSFLPHQEYGILDIDIVFMEQTLILKAFTGIMPKGSLVLLDKELTKKIDTHFTGIIYILQENDTVKTLEIVDIFDDDNKAMINFNCPELSLSTEICDNAIPIANFVKGKIDENFIIPLKNLKKFLPLCKVMQSISISLRNKVHYLQAQHGMDNFLKILIPCVTRMEHFLSLQHYSIDNVKEVISYIGGQIHSLFPYEFVPNFTKDLFWSASYITEKLLLIKENFLLIPFEKEDGIFKVPIESLNDFMVALHEDSDWIQSAIVCNDKMFALAKEKRLLGAARNLIESDVISNKKLWQIEQDPLFINGGKELWIANLAMDMAPKEMFLYVARSV